MIFRPLCLLLSAALFTLTIWPFGPPPPRSPLRWRPHKERWSEYWCLPTNPSKCEASFFLVDSHQANLQRNLFLLGSRLRFNPTPTFLGVTFDHALSFSKHVSLLKVKFFSSQSLTLYLCFLLGPSLLCIKLFFGPFSPMLHPDGFLS